MLVKNTVRSFLGEMAVLKIKSIVELFLLLPNAIYDVWHYSRSALIGFGSANKGNLSALIIKDSHRIEKGLSLHDMRIGFGKNVVNKLIANLERYINLYEEDYCVKYGVLSLQAYVDKHKDYPDLIILKAIHDFLSGVSFSTEGFYAGIDSYTQPKYFEKSDLCFSEFMKSRRSVRDFTGQKIDQEVVAEAVDMARFTPTVCNRQSGKVYFYNSPDDIRRLLELQNGNSGFGDKLGGVIIVTSDMTSFEGAGERNQMFVDGGLFLMNLLLSLHHLRVGACSLNWSVKYKIDKKMKKMTGIPSSEAIICLVGVGHVEEELFIASSPRKTLAEVYKFSNLAS